MRTTIEQWKELIAAHGRSGQSATEFCRERGIKDKRFFYWRTKLQEDSGAEGRFVSVGSSSELIAVELPGGKAIKVRRNDLGAVLEALCGR
jgi:transposase-like protein